MNKKRMLGLAISLFVLLMLLVALPFAGRNYVPKIVNGDGLTKDSAAAILSVEQGYYNSYLPLFATKIKIIEYSQDHILYRVYYFPFASIERSCTRDLDGNWIINLERPWF